MTIITEQEWYEIENSSNNDNNNNNFDNLDDDNTNRIKDGCKISNDPETKMTHPTTNATVRHLRSRSSSSSSSSKYSGRQLKTCNITQYMCSTTTTTTSSTAGASTSLAASNTTSANPKTSASASSVSTNHIQIEMMEVIYEYELYYNPNIDIHQTIIPYMEESIIINLASQMGIQQQCRTQNRRRQQHQPQRIVEGTNQTFTSSSGHQFIGIQTKPYDIINPKYTTCQYDIPNRDSWSESVVCVPMLGGVTVFVQPTTTSFVTSSITSSSSSSSSNDMSSSSSSYFTDTEQETIRTTVTSYLHEAMDQDVFVVPNSIAKLVFVGNSSTTTGNSSSSALSDPTIQTGWLVVLIGCLVLLLCCCCCCFLACCRRRRKRHNEHRPTTNDIESTNRSTVLVDVTRRENAVDMNRSVVAVEGSKQGLASFDSLALKDATDIETILFDEMAHDSEVPTDSDSSGFDEDLMPTTMVITGISNSNTIEQKNEPRVTDHEVSVNNDGNDNTNNNDDTSEELVGQKVVEMIEENEETVDVQDTDDAIDGESLIETMSDEMDLLDRLAMQGRPPPYPTTSQPKNNDLLTIAPTRSLSPTTISAASLGTSTYTGARNIVGSPTTCSQVTMPAGNLRYKSNRGTTSATTAKTRSGLMKKFMMVPQQKQRVNSSNDNSGSVRSAYTPDSFDEEILGINSDDSHEKTNRTTASTISMPVTKHMTVHDERQQYQQRHHPPTHTSITTYPDVLDEHLSNTFNENDEELDDDVFSFQSEHNNESTTAATSNAVQRHLQMS